jgi:hypothetical protein
MLALHVVVVHVRRCVGREEIDSDSSTHPAPFGWVFVVSEHSREFGWIAVSNLEQI